MSTSAAFTKTAFALAAAIVATGCSGAPGDGMTSATDSGARAETDGSSPSADSSVPDIDGESPDSAPTHHDGGAEAGGDGGVADGGACLPGHADCNHDPSDGCEKDLADDPKSCGACGHDCTALAHVSGPVSCKAGKCVVPDASCAKGFAHCSANADDGCEADLSKPATCGSCGNACSGATPVCDNGACTNGCTSATPTMCSGACVDTTSNVSNCGGCGNACSPPSHAASSCASSKCGFACNSGYHQCGSACSDNTSTASCGSSCTPCSPPANGSATCDGSKCGFNCNAGFHTCNGDGACHDNRSVATCGSSCTPCVAPGNATPTCDGTSCGFTCNGGFHQCGGACDSNGSVNSCGASCTPCPVPTNGTATCDGTSCGFSCNSGYHACGGACDNNNDVNSCGSACSPCPIPANANPTCDGTKCGFTCKAGFADCDGNAANGCEVNLAGDANNCNACGHSCLGGACSAGACQPVTIATNLNAPDSLNVSEAGVYIRTQYGAYINVFSMSGASETSYSTGFNGSVTITYGSGLVLVEDGIGTLFTLDSQLGNRSVVAQNLDESSGDHVAFAQGIPFVAERGASNRLVYVYQGSVTSKYGAAGGTIGSLVGDANGVAFIQYSPGNVYTGTLGASGLPPDTMLTKLVASNSGLDGYQAIGIDTQNVYFSSTDNNIWTAPRDGSAMASVFQSGVAGVSKILIDPVTHAVCWLTNHSIRAKVPGGGVSTIAQSAGMSDFGVNSKAWFWVDTQQGAIMKLAK